MRSRLLSLACSGVALMATDMARAGGLNSDPITEQPSAPEQAPAPVPVETVAQTQAAPKKASTKKASTKKAAATEADPAAMVAEALKEGFCVVVWCQPGHEQYRPGDLVLVDDAQHKLIRGKGHARDAEKSEIEAALANGTGVHFS